MHDLVRDWKRWSRTERLFAIAVTLVLLAVPLALGVAHAHAL